MSIQVLPATGANVGLSGAFDLASADGGPDILRMSGLEDQTTEDRGLTRKAAVTFDLVRRGTASRGQPGSHSGGSSVMEDTMNWRKPSYSSNGGGECVEVAAPRPGAVAVRDSRHPRGPVLAVTPAEWRDFIADVKAGQHDLT